MKKFLGWVGVFVLMASFFINVQSASANDIVLDTTFNSVGYVTHHSAAGGNSYDEGHSIQVQSDGKYVVTGHSRNSSSNYDMTIWRYNSNGTLDTTFNSTGYVTHDGAAATNSNDYGVSIDIQSDGKYVVVGYSYLTQSKMVIWRYNTNGTIDTTFNSVGYVTHSGAAGGSNDSGDFVNIQSDGKILVTGNSYSALDGTDMAIWRYNSNGTLDTTFNSTGYATHNAGSGGNKNDYGRNIQIQSDGKYVVVGTSLNASNNFDMTIWRYNTNGSIDTTFDSNGYTVHNNAAGGNSHDYGESLQIESNGKFVITGYSVNSSGDEDMAIWRYNSNGVIDTSFNTTGYTAHNNAAGGNSHDKGHSIVIQSDGKYVVTGESIRVSQYDMAIWRYNTNGAIDTSFNTNGYVTHHISGLDRTNSGFSLQIPSDGEYVVAGTANLGTNNDMAIWKYEEQITSYPTSLKNTLDNSAPGELVNMTIEYTPALTTAVTDGSVKLTLADEFDFTGISKADVSASGGDVTWSTDEIITVDGSIIAKNNSWIDKAYAQGEDSIVFGFTGDLDNTDGTITFTINGATAPLNPGSIGSYSFNVGVFSTSDGTGAVLEVQDGKVAIVSQVNVTATVPSSLTFSIDGVTSGNACANSGGNASVTTTSTTVPFGIYSGAQTKIACQTLTVSTNATNGYVVTVEQDQVLTSAGADTLKAFSGTYATPTTWASPPGSGTESYFGFTTDDTGYSDFQTSKYAAFGANDTPYNIMTGTDPVIDEANVISYQLEVTALQEAGTYSNTLQYIATATF